MQFVLHSPITFMVHFPSNTQRPDYPLDVRVLHTLITSTNCNNATRNKNLRNDLASFQEKHFPLQLTLFKEITLRTRLHVLNVEFFDLHWSDNHINVQLGFTVSNWADVIIKPNSNTSVAHYVNR